MVNRDVALDDGYFEAMFIRMPKNPLDFSNIVSYLFLKEEENELVYRFKTRRIRLVSEEETDWVLDGEFGGKRRDCLLYTSSIQAMGLKKRLEHTGCRDAVVGISGGLDSTLALLVTARAFDLLGIPRNRIHSITMPCFGTTDRCV